MGLVIFFNALSLATLIPIAKMMQMGYLMMVLFFIPFILLGLFLEGIGKKYGKLGNKIGLAIVALLLISSISKDYAAAESFANGMENNSKNSTLSEIESMTGFIAAAGFREVYFSGKKDLFSRFYKPISYLAQRKNIIINILESDLKYAYNPDSKGKINLKEGIPIFYIQSNNSKRPAPGQMIENHEIISAQKFSRQTILILKN